MRTSTVATASFKRVLNNNHVHPQLAITVNEYMVMLQFPSFGRVHCTVTLGVIPGISVSLFVISEASGGPTIN